jgi:hypothetical protein
MSALCPQQKTLGKGPRRIGPVPVKILVLVAVASVVLVHLTIAKAGQVSGSLGTDGFIGPLTTDGSPHLGEVAPTMHGQIWGFVVTQVDDAENIGSFRRQQTVSYFLITRFSSASNRAWPRRLSRST